MKLNKVIAIFAITLLFFIGVFLRPSYRAYPGMDAYYFKNYISSDKSNELSETPILGKWFFNILPDNDFIIKSIMFILTFGTVFMFGLIGEYYNKQFGWLAGLLLLTGVIFHNIFIRLEDDLLGIFLVSLSWYILVNYHRVINTNKFKEIMYILASLAVLAIAVFTWKWAIYFLILFALILKTNKIYNIITIGVVIVFFNRLLNGLMPNFAVSENLPVIGIVTLGLLTIGYAKSSWIKQNNLALIVASICTLVNAKFVFLLFPLLCLNFTNFISAMPKKLRVIVIVAVSIMLCVFAYSNYTALPSEDLYELVSEYQKLGTADIPSYNNWSYGYYLIYLGTATNSYGQPARDNVIYKNSYVLTYKKDPEPVKNKCYTIFFNRSGIIYQC